MAGEASHRDVGSALESVSGRIFLDIGDRFEPMSPVFPRSPTYPPTMGEDVLQNNDEEPYNPFNPSYGGDAPLQAPKAIGPFYDGKVVSSKGKKRRTPPPPEETSKKRQDMVEPGKKKNYLART